MKIFQSISRFNSPTRIAVVGRSGRVLYEGKTSALPRSLREKEIYARATFPMQNNREAIVIVR